MEYRIPLFDLDFDEREENAVIETLRSKWISTGPKTLEFEKQFGEILSVKHAVATTNCTAALHMAMKLCEINDKDEVICPSLTFVATVNAIRYVNAVPVFADVRSYDDLTIDPDEIERKITKKTKAVIVMHYAGFPCDMDEISAISQKYNLKIVEDACHGPLAEYKGKKLGTIGDIGCFSFFSNKHISTGEGGMLVTNNDTYFKRAKFLRSHGMTSLSYERTKGHIISYDVVDLGHNYRLDDIRAALGIVQLKKLKPNMEKRTIIRDLYLKELGDIEEIIIPFRNFNGFCSNYIFPIILKNSNSELRNNIRNKIEKDGIQTSIHYPAVHKFSFYKPFTMSLPITEYVTDNLITLPMYPSLDHKSVKYVCNSLKTHINREKIK